jgi:hypothetical protein
MSRTGDRSIDPWLLCERLDACAKWWWGASALGRGAGFALGALSVLNLVPAKSGPFALAAVSLCFELAMLRSDGVRATAQRLRRRLEFLDGLGRELDEAEYSDLVVRSPSSVKKAARCGKKRTEYFGSSRPVGAERLLENLAQSAWWSKHLAEAMRLVLAVAVTLTVLGAIVMLIVSVHHVSSTANAGGAATARLDETARIVSSTVVLLFSIGAIRLVLTFHQFAASSGVAEQQARRALAGSDLDAVAAERLLHEYQLARAGAPMVPQWIYNFRKKELNREWRAP